MAHNHGKKVPPGQAKKGGGKPKPDMTLQQLIKDHQQLKSTVAGFIADARKRKLATRVDALEKKVGKKK